MTSLLRSIFNASPTGQSKVSKSPSFDDFSLGCSQEVETDLRRSSSDSQTDSDVSSPRERPGSYPGATRHNVWQEVFNPGKNFNMTGGKDYYDTVDAGKKEPTTWEYIAKADNMKRLAFANFDRNGDGYIDAGELRAALGPQASVQQLIKQADKNGDGKIDYYEFCQLMKDSN